MWSTSFVDCRHQGQLHTEVISTRLHGGRWRTYVIELSGNQLSLYVNCQREMQRIIPLPDYCINDAEVVVSVADTSYSQHEEYSGREKLHVSSRHECFIHFMTTKLLNFVTCNEDDSGHQPWYSVCTFKYFNSMLVITFYVYERRVSALFILLTWLMLPFANCCITFPHWRMYKLRGFCF